VPGTAMIPACGLGVVALRIIPPIMLPIRTIVRPAHAPGERHRVCIRSATAGGRNRTLLSSAISGVRAACKSTTRSDSLTRSRFSRTRGASNFRFGPTFGSVPLALLEILGDDSWLSAPNRRAGAVRCIRPVCSKKLLATPKNDESSNGSDVDRSTSAIMRTRVCSAALTCGRNSQREQIEKALDQARSARAQSGPDREPSSSCETETH
jgi:hypothetical protein